jgi:hypothetical protein
MGQPCPGHLQGGSLRKALEGNGPPPQPDVFIAWHQHDAGILRQMLDSDDFETVLGDIASREEAAEASRDPVRTVFSPDGWKLNWSQRGDHELYNVSRDPGETTNLIARSDSKALISDLSDRICRWQERTEDTVTLPPI